MHCPPGGTAGHTAAREMTNTEQQVDHAAGVDMNHAPSNAVGHTAAEKRISTCKVPYLPLLYCILSKIMFSSLQSLIQMKWAFAHLGYNE